MAHIHNSCGFQPFHASAVVFEARSFGDFADLELLVLLRQLDRDMPEHVEDSGPVHAVRVFLDVFLVVQNQLTLHIQGALEGAACNVGGDDLRHAADGAVVEERRSECVHLDPREGP